MANARRGSSKAELRNNFRTKFERTSLSAQSFRRRCAWGTHPFPSRTRRLRPKRPMVLHWRRCGRAGGCRIPFKKNREKFYYNKTGIDIQNPVTPERSYEIPFELKRSVPTHISREVLLHITGFTSDQRIEQKFSFLMTDKASVKNL